MRQLIISITILLSGILIQAQNDIIIPQDEESLPIFNCQVQDIYFYQVTYEKDGITHTVLAREVIKEGKPAIKLPVIRKSESGKLPIQELAEKYLWTELKRSYTTYPETVYGKIKVKVLEKRGVVTRVVVQVANSSEAQIQIEKARDYEHSKYGDFYSDYWYGESKY